MGRICDACLDGNSRAVTGDNSDGPTSTGVGTDGTTSTRAIDSDGGATSEQESKIAPASLEEDRGPIDGTVEVQTPL